MATIGQCTGFEIPDVNSYGSPNGTSPTVSSAQARTKPSDLSAAGSSSLRVAATNALSYVLASSSANAFGWTAATRSALRISFYMVQMPSATISLFQFGPNANLASLRMTSGGTLRMVLSAGTAVDYPTTIVTGRWYTVEFEVDTSVASNWVVHWKVDGAAQTDATYTASATTPTHGFLHFGNSLSTAVGTYEFHLDDFALSTTAGDYPIGNGYVVGYGVNASGSHNISTGAFQDDGGNAITAGETTSHTKLEEATPDTSSYVQQTTQASGNYLEYALADTGSPTQTPRCVRPAHYSSTAGGVVSGSGRLHDGTSDSTIATSNSATFSWHENPLSTRAGAQGAWTTAAIDALTYRVGFRSSATANTQVRSSWAGIEVEYLDDVYASRATGADDVVLAASAAEALVDTGSDNALLSPSGTDTIPDAGADTASLTTTGSEALADTGAATATFTDSMVSEAIAESAADTLVLTESGSYVAPSADATDSGEDTLALTAATSSEALVDQGSLAVTATPSRVREAIAESAADDVLLTASAATAVGESDTDVAVATTSASEAIADRGTANLVQTPARIVEAIADSGESSVSLTPVGIEETIFDGATVITLASASGAESIVDQGSSTVSFTAVADIEAIADQGADEASLRADGVDAPYELGEVSLGLADAGSETLADTAMVVLVLSPSGRAVRIAGRRGHITLSDSPTRRASLTITVDTGTLIDQHEGAAGLGDRPARRGGLAVSSGKLTLEDA